MALAQGTDLLLLDEPTTFLDLTHQIEVLDLLCDLNREQDRTIVCVLHDLNLACRYAHHLVAMRDGAIVAEGPPAEIVTQELVQDVFELDARIIPDPVSGHAARHPDRPPPQQPARGRRRTTSPSPTSTTP